jgi:hypothetical protein
VFIIYVPVAIDWILAKRKKITCTLEQKGRPREYLSSFNCQEDKLCHSHCLENPLGLLEGDLMNVI